MFIHASNLMQEELVSAVIRNPLVLPPDATMMEAIAQMSGMRALCQFSSEASSKLNAEIDARSSCVVIVENDQPIGIVTEQDVVRLTTQKTDLENLPIRDVMSRDLITLRESQLNDLLDPIGLLRKHQIRHLLIVDDRDYLVGLLTHENLQQISRPMELLRLRTVEEVMTTEVVCAESHLVIREIAYRMTKYRVSSVVIVQTQPDQGQTTRKIPIGIVTERDVVQCQALGLDIETAQAQTIMSTPVFSVQLGESLLVVQQMMERHRIKRLVVTEAQGGLIGIVTQASLLQALNSLELYNLAKVLGEKVSQLEAEKIQILQSRALSLEKQVEERTAKLQAKAERERITATISSQIRASLDLPAILNTTVAEVRKILGCDRVAIWQLQPDFHLLNMAESHTETIASRVGQQVYDECFGPDWSEAYRLGRVQVVADIYTTEMADCHRELLEKLQTRAKVLTPIIQGDILWGLLEALEGHAPREWQPEEVKLLEQLATQLAIAIQKASNHQQLQNQLQERQQLIAQLQKSEKQYAILTSMAPVGIFRTDASGSCIYTNERCYQMSGLTQAEVLGNGWEQRLHPDDRDRVLAEWNRATHENRAFSLEYRFERPDGVVTWVYGQAVPEWNANGDLIGYVGTITDIGDRKRAEQELQTLNQSLEAKVKERAQELWQVNQLQRAILDGTDYAIISTDLDGIIHTFNAGAEKMLGYTVAEVAGKMTPAIFFDPQEISENFAETSRESGQAVLEGRELLRELMSKVLQGNFNAEWTNIRKDGSRFPAEISGSVLNDDSGEPIGFLSISKDISDRKQAELALQKSEERFRQMFDSNVVGMVFADFQGKIIDTNDRFLEMLGYTREDLETDGINWINLTPPEYLAQDYESIEYLIKHGEIAPREKEYYRKDGSRVAILIGAAFLPNTDNEVICVIIDISDRKQAELQLQQTTDRLALALKSGAIGYWEFDLQQNSGVWDDRMYELYGHSEKHNAPIPHEIWANAVHPDDLDGIETLIQQAILGEAEYDYEFRVIHPDRSIHFIKAYGEVTRDSQGNAQSVIGINFDITAQKQAEQTIRQQIEKETLLRQVTQHIRATLDRQKIFDTACQEIRQFMQTDRVAIFRFDPDSEFDNGAFVAESVRDGLSSVIAIPVHDHCFGEDYAHRYAQGRFQAVSDVLNSDLQDCHKAVLAQFQIRANLVIPLLRGEELWGLLCIHNCTAPRVWEADEIDLVQQIASQLAIAIQQGNLYNQIQAELITRQRTEEKIVLELRRQKLLGEIIQSVRDSFDVSEILVNVTHKTQEILNGDRVIVFQLFPDGRSKIVEESVSDQFPSLKNLHWDDEVWSQEILDYYWQGMPRIVPDVMDDQWTDCLVEYSTQGQIKSKIVAPILQEVSQKEDHRWISAKKRDRLWGVLVVYACSEKRVWQDQEAEIVQQIANQLAIAIQQADLFEQLQQEQQKLIQTNEALAYSNADLARATRLKDEFLANMSHELRTPLNAILGMSEGLQEEVFGTINERQINALQTIERSGLHLLSLINDILDVAKIQSGQIELDYQSVAITHICSSSLVFLKQQALQKRIRLETQFAPDLTNVFVDERRIRQVLINLLTNAVKFTPEGGKVTLTTARLPKADDTQQHYLRIAVTDTGIGIAPENIKKLFQPFVQIDSALNRQYTGTGLGLALVKQIVELHGGRVNLTSELGVGSCFSIDLPCEPAAISANNPTHPLTGQNDAEASTAPLSSPLILLAEDNEANIDTVSCYLTAKGYRVISAKNGKEAIAMTYAESPDLILMDIQMPEMDGLESIRRLRQDPNLSNIPIIALTALAMSGDRERCIEAGANDYLSKPVRLKELAALIKEFSCN